MMRSFFLAIFVVPFLMLTACSKHTPASGRLDESSARVGIMVLDAPRTMTVDTDFKVILSIRNTGQISLPSLGKEGDLFKVGVSYHWKGTDERVVVWDGIFTPLQRDLKIGQSEDVELAVRAPSAPGRYILEVDMLQNSAFWFNGVGSQAARISVDIK